MRGVAIAALWLVSGGPARPASAVEGSPCADDARRVGDLGITSLDCDCTYDFRSRSSGGRVRLAGRWSFRSEPQVDGIRAGGPAAGKLREGDVITAIDGVLITTREGSRRFAEVEPGAATTLTVRREDREIPVRIVAGAVCPEMALWPTPQVRVTPWAAREVEPAEPAEPGRPAVAVEAVRQGAEPAEGPDQAETPAPPAAPRVPRLPTPAVPSEDAYPRGWSGFALTCNCGGNLSDPGGPPVWEFGTLPSIYFVDPESPAARAGIQIGDLLTHLDGVSLLSEEGGRRFGALKPGQSARWTFLRGGKERRATIVTEPRPGDRTIRVSELQERLRALGESDEIERLAKAAEELSKRGLLTPAPRASGRRLRYAGVLGGSEVEVRGLGTVVVDDSGDEIVITTRDATIRIRPAAAPAASTPKGERKPR